MFWCVAESFHSRVPLNHITEVTHFLEEVNYENFISFITAVRKIIHTIPDYLKKIKEDTLQFYAHCYELCKSNALLSFRELNIDYTKLEKVCSSYTVYLQSFDALNAIIAFMNVTFEEIVNDCKRLIIVNPNYDIVTRKSLDKITAIICKLLNASRPNAGDLIASVTSLRHIVDSIHQEMQRKTPVNVTFLFESQYDILNPLNDLGEIKERFNLDLIDLNSYKQQIQYVMRTWLDIYRLFNQTILNRKCKVFTR